MKQTILATLLLLLFQYVHSQSSLQVMTFNIRLNTASDSANAWPFRKDKVASQILFHKADILGVQEALHNQMTDLEQRLPQYKYTGGGRDDGKTKGEYSAIFFNTSRLKLIATETFWLSETPAIPGSKSWDAAITRIVTWAKFKDRKSKKIFFVFNTHFDHVGKVARKESAHLLKRKVQEIAGTTPVIITGDFNAKPSDEPIQVLLNNDDNLALTDSRSISETPHYGPEGTFNGFRSKENDIVPIDYIFLKGKWNVKSHATISQTWLGKFASDHYAVIAEMSL